MGRNSLRTHLQNEYPVYEELGHVRGELGHLRGEVGRRVHVLPIHTITYYIIPVLPMLDMLTRLTKHIRLFYNHN